MLMSTVSPSSSQETCSWLRVSTVWPFICGVSGMVTPYEPKAFPKVDYYDSTAAAPHRGLRRDSRLALLSGPTLSLPSNGHGLRSALAGRGPVQESLSPNAKLRL